MVRCVCPQCKGSFDVETGRFNRAQKIGAPLYCGKACAGLARRRVDPPTEAERKAAKAEYDRQYRERNAEKRKQQKAEYFQRTYDPAKAAKERKARAHLHAEYCRRHEYKAWKSQYDRRYRADKEFGEFADVALLLQDIEAEIDERATRSEIYRANGTTNKAQTRRRAL